MTDFNCPANSCNGENQQEKEQLRHDEIACLEYPVLFVGNFNVIPISFHGNVHNVIKNKLDYRVTREIVLLIDSRTCACFINNNIQVREKR